MERGRWHRWRGRLLAAALGMPLALAFPRPALWWCAFVGLVPLLLWARAAPTGREAAMRGWCGGIGFFLAVDSWLLPNTGVFTAPAALFLGALWLPLGWLGWRLLRDPLSAGRLAAAVLLLPAVWVLGEVVRSWSALGGPWALLGASQWNDRPVLAVAAIGGVWAVSFLLVAVNVAVAAALAPRPRGGPGLAGLGLAGRAGAVVVAAVLVGAAAAYGATRPAPPAAGSVRVALVQPGIIHQVEPRFEASETASLALGAQHPDLIVWSESSIGRDPAANPGDVARLERIVRATGADVLANVDARRGTGTGTGTGGGIYKNSLLIGPDGPLGSYDKMRLVPFGEYVPLRPLLGWVTHFTKAATENRHHGQHLVVLHAATSSGPLALGPLICFESSFPDLGRGLANLGADLIVIQSATTTFQGTWGPDQHASLAAVRAVESGRPVVQASISGVSAAFDPSGRRLAWYPQSWRGAAVVTMPLARATTLYDRWGEWVPAASALIVVVAGVAAVRRRVPWRGASAVPGRADLVD
ncbi:MAG TPA: apolipoprotein N-acyltransferase [Actinomycetota bacterium]